MKKACKLASECLKLCLENSKEGITTDIIDNMAYDFYIKNNAYPAGLNFHSFPKSICASPNEGTLSSQRYIYILIYIY